MSGSLFTFSPLTDGPLHTAADHNGPDAAIAAILNGGIGTVNIVPGGLDGTVFTDAANPQKITADIISPFVVSGLTISTSGSLSSTTAAGIAYVNGKKLSPASTPHTYTASKDTYVDLKDDGTYTYVEVANGASSGMTLTTNTDGTPALRVAKVVTSGSAVTSTIQIGPDALSNTMYNRSPEIKTAVPVLYRQGNDPVNFYGGGTTNYDLRGKPVFSQVGSILGSAGGDVTVTYPVPFSIPPNVQAVVSSASGANASCQITGVSSTSFAFRTHKNTDNSLVAELINWLATGY